MFTTLVPLSPARPAATAESPWASATSTSPLAVATRWAAMAFVNTPDAFVHTLAHRCQQPMRDCGFVQGATADAEAGSAAPVHNVAAAATADASAAASDGWR